MHLQVVGVGVVDVPVFVFVCRTTSQPTPSLARSKHLLTRFSTFFVSISPCHVRLPLTGYGDLSMGVELRWFQIFYLMASTYYVGNAISGLASLKDRLDEVRRQFAWSRREVSKGMVVDMQGDGDDTIDQYEFAMASLLALGKISSDDLRPIMDKYRELANPRTGFIVISEACEGKVANEATLQRLSSTTLRKRGVRSDERFSTLNHHDVAKLEDEIALDQRE